MSYHYETDHKKAEENLSKKASGLSTKSKIKGLESKPIYGTIIDILRGLDIPIITPIKKHIDNSDPMNINKTRNNLKFISKIRSSSKKKNMTALVAILKKLHFPTFRKKNLPKVK